MCPQGYLEREYKLKTYDKGDMITCDKEDYDKAKYVTWYSATGRVLTQQGVSFEDYVGIKGTKKHQVLKFNMRRRSYG